MPEQAALPLTGTIEDRWRAFHEQNPAVYDRLVRMARQLRGQGVEHWGIKALWEVLRFTTRLGAKGDGEVYRLNNSYCALYARLIMEREPDLRGFFETRERTA